jgi:hypothetical protein
LSLVLLFAGAAGFEPEAFAQQDERPGGEAAALFARFLARQTADAPVAGEFEVRGVISQQALAAHVAAVKGDAARRGLGVVAPAPNPFLHCRWAWDGTREMLDSLDGSTVFEAFFSTPDTLLEGVVERNYNLGAPKAPYPVRPASFYFLLGTRSWEQVAQEARVEFDDAGPPPVDTRGLRIVLPVGRVRLFIREADFRLQGHELFLNEKMFHRLQITRFASGADGRAFPELAKLEVFDPNSGDVIRTDELHATRILFPSGKAELAAAFAMQIPAKSEIHDLLLNKELVLNTDTPALDVINGDSNREWTSMEQRPSAPLAPAPGASGRRWMIWANVVALAVIALAFLYRAFRKK